MTNELTRRALLAAAPAVAVVPSIGMAKPADDAAIFALYSEWLALQSVMNNMDVDAPDEEFSAAMAQAEKLNAEIWGIEAKTADGFAIQSYLAFHFTYGGKNRDFASVHYPSEGYNDEDAQFMRPFWEATQRAMARVNARAVA